MDVPEVILVGDWSCPNGHFNSSMSWQCARCIREGKAMSAVHVFLRATDDASVERLRDFLHDMKVKENLSRPSSNEAVAEAVAAAGRSVEEIIEERDAKSDRGVPAPARSDLTAEEQTALLALMVAKKKKEDEAVMRATDPSVRIAGGEDAASVRSAGSDADRFSDGASYKTATWSQASTAEKRAGRQRVHLQGKAEKGTLLTHAGHAQRQQVAAILQLEPQVAESLTEPEVVHVHRILVTQKVEEITGGLVCETQLMGLLETEFVVRDGVEGTLFRVTVAAQSEAFVATRDPVKLAEMGPQIENDLINQAVSAVARAGAKDSAEQRTLRLKLKGTQQLANLRKAPGVKDLTLVGFCGDKDERKAQASAALDRLMKESGSRFSPLVDEPDWTNVEGMSAAR